MKTAEIIAIIEDAIGRVHRDARPAREAAREMLEKQRRLFDELECALEDAVHDVHLRQKLVRYIDDATTAVWELPEIIESIYGREDFQDFEVLLTDLRMEERMGSAWTEGPDSPAYSRRPPRRPDRFGFGWTGFSRRWSITVSATASKTPRGSN